MIFASKLPVPPSHLPFSSLTVTPETVLNSVPSAILRCSNLSQPLFSWALLQCFFDKNYTIRHVPVWEVSVIDLFSCPLFLLLRAANPSDYVANSVQLISYANNPHITTDSSLRTQSYRSAPKPFLSQLLWRLQNIGVINSTIGH